MITSYVKTMSDFSFRGRSSQREFVCFLIMSLLISVLFVISFMWLGITVLGLKINFLNGDISIPYRMKMFGVVPFILMSIVGISFIFYAIWTAISGALLAIRRLHDMNCSGVGYWVWFTSVFCFCFLQTSLLTAFLFWFIIGGIFALCINSGFPSDNKYGKVISGEVFLKI